MASYGLLDQAAEDALHHTRLLNVEERPFKRITKKLLATESPLFAISHRLPTPPPEGPETAPPEAEDDKNTVTQRRLAQQQQFREEVLLDFAAYESSIIRIQLLLNSNEKERERYAAEKLRIQAASQAVRDSTIDLRTQLEAAQATLALRKTYDELADKITSNRMLRPREDQHAALEKLDREIIELELESREYARTWADRRAQFGKIVDEGMHLRRHIRDEKEEVERREGMEERDDASDGEGVSAKGRSSTAPTPRPEAGGATPAHPSIEDPTAAGVGGSSSSLSVDQTSRLRARSPLRASSLAPDSQAPTSPPAPVTEDVNMAESGEISGDETSGAPAEAADRMEH